jgi:hypothetical protein
VLVCTRNDEGISVQAMRRSVDMGSLAHNANMRHGANTASMQGAPQAGMPQQAAPNQKVGITLSRSSLTYCKTLRSPFEDWWKRLS